MFFEGHASSHLHLREREQSIQRRERLKGCWRGHSDRRDPSRHKPSHLAHHSHCSYFLWHRCGMGNGVFSPPTTRLTLTPMMLSFSDGSGRTATGTICIEVPDANDYCPVIHTETRSVCIDASSVRIYVSDHSFGSPFTFCVVDEPSDTASIWHIRSINGKWSESYSP